MPRLFIQLVPPNYWDPISVTALGGDRFANQRQPKLLPICRRELVKSAVLARLSTLSLGREPLRAACESGDGHRCALGARGLECLIHITKATVSEWHI